MHGVKGRARERDGFVRGWLISECSSMCVKNKKRGAILPRATKNLSYRQLYRFLTKSPRMGSSGRIWMTSGALISCEVAVSNRKVRTHKRRTYTLFEIDSV